MIFKKVMQCQCVDAYHISFIHSSVEGYLGCFQFLAIMNKAAMNIVEQVHLWKDATSWVDAQEWDSWVLREINFKFSETLPY